jgi:uncharacterized protein (UPF0335 family)
MDTGGIAGDQLRSLIERYEAKDAAIRQIDRRKAELFDEARAVGINPHVLKLTIQRRRLERQIRAAQALVEEAAQSR